MAIQPDRLILLKDDPKLISERVNTRDSSKWDVEFVSYFQEQEERHAIQVSDELGISLEVYDNSKNAKNRMKRSVHWNYLLAV